MAGERVNITNRKARFQYELLEEFEAGIELMGCEVKSVRLGNISLDEAYCRFMDGELFLVDCRISPYKQAGSQPDLSPTRPRKLLLRAAQLKRLQQKVATKGLTIVPLRVYNSGRLIKVEIGLARGKTVGDKRETIKRRDDERAARRFTKRHR